MAPMVHNFLVGLVGDKYQLSGFTYEPPTGTDGKNFFQDLQFNAELGLDAF